MTDSTPAQQQTKDGRRKRLMLIIALIFAVAGLGWGTWWLLVGRHFEKTDNAYVAGNLVPVTPLIAGTVEAIRADDTDLVRAGQDLVQLDGADAQVALDQAEAQLAQAVREVRGLFSGNTGLQAEAALKAIELRRSQDDLARRLAAGEAGAVSKEELAHARDAVAAAAAALTVSREKLATNRSLIDGTTVAAHPNVLRAAAHYREAFLARQRTILPAPVSGYVAKRNVQVGQKVQPGAPLMVLVPLDQLWVDANFKEVQLHQLRIGQPVKLNVDYYGNDVVFHGQVAGLGAGTGSVFSLLPAQNATGNWIKVVQRLPVRISLDAKELAAHPLRLGLSVQVAVDVTQQDGESLARQPRLESSLHTDVFAARNAQADQRIAEIIAANSGKGAADTKAGR